MIARLRPWLRWSALAAAITWSIAAVTLFVCYLHVARTSPVTSDGASNALQAWDMMHRNPLLRGWRLSDVSFYTTELPQYALIEHFRGLSIQVVHVASAMTYTLLVLLAALLAKSRATGREAIARCVIAAGIMLAPQLGDGVYVLVGSPDHTGSTVPVLATFILLDRVGRRWWVPIAAGVLLAWAQLGDPIVLFIGIVPVVAVALIRAYQIKVRQAGRWRSCAFELALAAFALLAAFAADVTQHVITARGGFVVWPISDALAPATAIPHNLGLTLRGLLMLFGANFLGHQVGLAATLAALHLVAIGLAGWAVCAVFRRLGSADLAAQLLSVAIVSALVSYLVSTRPVDLLSSRDIVAVLPFGAALAGRTLAGRLIGSRLLPALAVVLAGVVISLGRLVIMPPAQQPEASLATWLAAHNLTSGLAGYWDANIVTLESGGRVRLVSMLGTGFKSTADYWEVSTDWYDAARNDATYVVLIPSPPGFHRYPTVGSVRETFGQPARIYYVGSYTVLVWQQNLLSELSPGVPLPVNPAAPGNPGPAAQPAQ